MNFLKNNNSTITINLPASVRATYNRHISLEIIIVQNPAGQWSCC